ncbi:MAG: DUF5131 family protein [Clostridia bacterium]|nr:DUF5131 family protein [Clostridia bacterium]
MAIWNPWHGCHKKSAGCLNCYMFRRDSMYDKDSNIVVKTKDFNLGIKKHRDGSYYLEPGENVYTCMTSDFLIEEADSWRNEIWNMIRLRQDLHFTIITKRIERFKNCIPEDWNDGYDNVTICSTCENQETAEERLPIFLELPIKHREIIHEPMLESINIEKYLQSHQIEFVTCGGESGDNARECHYDWILNTREQCKKYQVPFYFKQTGANFVKNGKRYHIPRNEQLKQARKANIDLNWFDE